MFYKSFQIIPIILVVAGTWVLAKGLRVKKGISDDLRREANIDEEKDLIVPSEVQETLWIPRGLWLITIGGIIQALLIILS